MPYKKSYKKVYRRPGYRACGRMVVSDASKALSIARNVKNLLNVEIKNHDVQQTSVVVSTSPQIIQLTNIAQGDTTTSRDGAQCKVLSIELAYQIAQSTSALITSFRIMLVCDKQTNQSIYASTDLLNDVSTQDAIVSPRNLDNMRRFQVLYDRVHSYSDGGVSLSVTRKRFKLNKVIRFDSSAASIGALTENSISLLMVFSEATNLPAITSSTRIRFVDN